MQIRRKITEFAQLSWGPVALVFVAAIAFRLIVALWLPAEIVWDDGHRYRLIADNLLSGRGFGSLADNALSVPTQPLLIAAVDLVTGGGYRAERIFFALLGSITCVFGYMLAKRLFDPMAGLLAGCLLAVYPYLVYSSALFEYPQTFFIFMMGPTFILLYDFVRSNRRLTLFGCGLCLGVGILTVPTALIFAPLLTISLWRGGMREIFLRTVILFVAVCIPVGSWGMRNYVAYGHFVLVNEAAGRNFWSANNETYYQFGKEGIVRSCETPGDETAFCREFNDLGIHVGDNGLTKQQIVFAYEKASWAKGLKFVRESPQKFFILVGKKFLWFWSPVPDAVSTGTEHGGAMRTWIAVGSYGPVLVLGLLGFALSAPRWQLLLPIYLYFFTFAASHSVFMPTTRYRLPLDFFLVLFAAYAVVRLARGAAEDIDARIDERRRVRIEKVSRLRVEDQ